MSDLTVASAVASQWFEPLTPVVRQVFGGATNLTFHVQGAGRTYYLRRYRKLTRSAVIREHALIRHLAHHGIPAPQPAARADASTVFETADGAAWALFEAASGEQIDHNALSPARAHAKGALLAQLHAAAAEHGGHDWPTWQLSWNGPAWVARLDRICAAISAREAPDVTDHWALQRVRAQRAWLAQPACLHHYASDFPAQLIHGDYQLANLFFKGDRVSAVIDWDNAVRMPRAFELARACFFSCQMEPVSTRAFVAGYRTVCSLTASELSAGAQAWGVYADHHVWPLEETYLHGNPAAKRFIWPRPFQPFAEEWAAADV